jgi:asparagine synthase (glutamine-hydrolysing)
LIRILKERERISTRNFGGFCPYYYKDNDTKQVTVGDTAGEIIPSMPKQKRKIDPTACLSLFCFNAPLGDRTLIQELKRMPWHSTLYSDGTIERRRPIPHGHRIAEPSEIANSLIKSLQEELSSYIDEYKRIWILLTGGLDSRVTAGIVHSIQSDFNADIHAITWGMEKSRDVAYASQIAKKYGWEWHHLPYDEELLWSNLSVAADWGGAEVAGVHLHAICDLKKLVSPDDLVIASSWGDSIGRAEFSGRHLTNMSLKKITNRHLLIHRSIVGECLQLAESDRSVAWSSEPDCSTHVIVELDAQENYMRRVISHAMNYVIQFCHLEQAFTADKTVSTMWSYSPICRQTEVYFRLFEKLDRFLFNLPWARTGIAPSGDKEQDISLAVNYHNWGIWMRQGKHRDLKQLVCDGGLSELGIFNMSQVRRCFSDWLKQPSESVGLTETILQLATIELFRRRFDLVSAGDKTDLMDYLMSKAYRYGEKAGKKLVRTFRTVR